MHFFPMWTILPAAFLLDLLVGDPRCLPHPVRWMGKAIETLEPRFRKISLKPTVCGALFALSLIIGAWALTVILLTAAHILHPLLKPILEVLLIYYCISVHSLDSAAKDVLKALDRSGLEPARQKVALIVGRDTASLSQKGIIRATVETVSENLVDGVISPLFFAAIGGAPLAVAYKMVNTLDSMVGYKNETYKAFGKAAARIDDAANFIPARLAVPVVALAAQILTGCGRQALKTGLKEGADHTSPNAGYPEAAFAGALGVKLGGPNRYGGQLIEKPYIGKRFKDAASKDITRACDLMLLAATLWLGIAWSTTALTRVF